LLNPEVTEFCDVMGDFFSKIERDLYKDLEKGQKLNDLKKSYQIKYGINARQFNSIHIILKGKIASRKECYKSQIKQTELKIKSLQKTIDSQKKKLAKLPLSCGRNQKSVRSKLRFTLHQKQRKLATLKDRLAVLKKKKPSLVFGGKKLWYAQFNLKENGYSSHQEWLKDWQKSRSSQFTLVGSKDETNGNQNCQLLPQGLKVRVPPCYESIFGKYYLIKNVKFSYGQSEVDYALNNEQALTFRFVKKGEKWYIFCSFDLPETPTISEQKKWNVRDRFKPECYWLELL